MSGRYLLKSSAADMAQQFRLDIRENIPARYNIAPTQPIAVIRAGERGGRRFEHMRWGFIPSWRKTPETRPLINARSETAAEKPTFRAAFKRRRCLIPADGFYEWKGKAGAKTPYCIMREDGALFAFAGLWETAVDPSGGEIDTVAILTTAAGPDLLGLNSREPVVVAVGAYHDWLHTDETRAGNLAPLLAAGGKGAWRAFRIGPAVGDARNDGPELIAPAKADLFD